MNGSEFQETWRYMLSLERRIKMLEEQMLEIPRVLKLTPEQEEDLAKIAWEQHG